MHWAEAHGKVPPGTAEKWEEHTPKDKQLPERVGMKKKAFWCGFEKAANTDEMGQPGAPLPGEMAAQDVAGGMPPQPPEKMLKWNPAGGVDPRSPEDMAASQAVDMITLPEGVEGTNCGNCQFVRVLDPGLGTGFCTNPQVKQDVTSRMCCNMWNAPGTYRAWEAADPAAVPNAGMLQEAAGVDASGLPAAAAAAPPMVAGAMPEGSAGDKDTAKGPMGPGAGGEGQVGDAGASPAEDKKPKKDKDSGKKSEGGGHTINVHVNNGGGGKDDGKKSEKKAFWNGFGW